MNYLLEAAQALSALGFFGYGIGCLTLRGMKSEFVRYGLPHWRLLTGTLQIFAGAGLLLGYAYPILAMLAALGLSLMMLVAVGIRFKIKDPLSGCLQALVCMLLNLFILRGYVLRLVGKN